MLTEIQSRVARIMARNRTEERYFAGGAALDEKTARLSDDLDVFTDSDDMIPDIVDLDLKALDHDGLDVTVDLEIHGCTDVTVRDGRQSTRVQWMSESRTRFFPLRPDSLWGLRLHVSDLAANKVVAASTRRQARDMVDLALIRRGLCPLGPLFLGASMKLPALSPLALLENTRRWTVSYSSDELREVRLSSPNDPDVDHDQQPEALRRLVLVELQVAETFLRKPPPTMLDGLPVNENGIPVDRTEAAVAIRPLSDGGGRLPDFPQAVPDFGQP